MGERQQGTCNWVTLSRNAGPQIHPPTIFPRTGCTVRWSVERQSVAKVWSSVHDLIGNSVGGQGKDSEIANIY